jgi:hypothetical protein
MNWLHLLAVEKPKANAAFELIENRIRAIFTTIGRYSKETILNPGDTAEVPVSESEPNLWVVFDEYSKPHVPFRIGTKSHGLLLCVEVDCCESDLTIYKALACDERDQEDCSAILKGFHG